MRGVQFENYGKQKAIEKDYKHSGCNTAETKLVAKEPKYNPAIKVLDSGDVICKSMRSIHLSNVMQTQLHCGRRAERPRRSELDFRIDRRTFVRETAVDLQFI